MIKNKTLSKQTSMEQTYIIIPISVFLTMSNTISFIMFCKVFYHFYFKIDVSF